MKAYKTYFGAKGSSGVPQVIVNHIRPCSRFVELFGGNATISHHLAVSTRLVNDLSGKVFQKYKQLNGFEYCNVDYRDVPVLPGDTVYLDPPYLADSRRGGGKKSIRL